MEMSFFFFTDCKFINYPPSMIAAGSVGAAAHGLLKTDNTKLLQSLHQILNIDVVGISYSVFVLYSPRVNRESCFSGSLCCPISTSVAGVSDKHTGPVIRQTLHSQKVNDNLIRF